MKKSGNKENQKNSIFTKFTSGSSPSGESPVSGPGKDHQVRHVENPVSLPFMKDLDSDSGEFGQAEDMRKWGLGSKEATVKSTKRNVLVGLGVAVGILILALASVFFILPRVLPGLFKGTNIELFVQKQVNRVYTDSSYRVINEPVVSIYSSPDVTSDRISQVLYNEVVTLTTETPINGFIRIETLDGVAGFIKEDAVISDMSSVEPDLYQYKLVISNPSKNIMTHASNGTLITKALMNTVLYGNVKRDGVYQVNLPGGGTGWIGSSGVIEIGTRSKTDTVSSRYFVSSVMTFVNSTYLEDGITMKGASVNGIAYVCSSINGIDLPRSMDEQSQLGDVVQMDYDAVNGNLIVENILPGDFVFLRSPNADSTDNRIVEMAICTDTGSFFMIAPTKTTVRLREFDSGNSFYDRIVTVRRFFEAD